MIRNYIILSILAIVLLCGGGCKKQASQTPPKRYDPKVDAIAARPLPAMDYTQAQRVLRDGAISPTQDISTGDYREPETSTPTTAPTPGSTPSFAPTTTTPSETPAPQPGFNWGSDPNSN